MELCNSHWPSVLYFLSWFISCEGRVSTVNDTAKSKECNISVLSHAMNCSSLFLNPVSFLSYIVSKNRTGTIVIQRKKNQHQNKEKEKELTQHTIHFLNPNNFFSNLNSNCFNLSDMRNLQEQLKKTFCYQKLF